MLSWRPAGGAGRLDATGILLTLPVAAFAGRVEGRLVVVARDDGGRTTRRPPEREEPEEVFGGREVMPERVADAAGLLAAWVLLGGSTTRREDTRDLVLEVLEDLAVPGEVSGVFVVGFTSTKLGVGLTGVGAFCALSGKEIRVMMSGASSFMTLV